MLIAFYNVVCVGLHYLSACSYLVKFVIENDTS